ncbi:glutamine amidotransferase-related protein [Magnetofaba australis]|uniref:Putative glutamine amidotransferase n=1 Tax=Magnetofaba australis IT-1 TaxID=1434232 RepID=A0A1Y2K1D0_9PROT|nr:hypothetical protein [Magnetofaba australis]OSM01487.1 putative glutamine amidotransferase [Magnetofaba australis IT-1]
MEIGYLEAGYAPDVLARKHGDYPTLFRNLFAGEDETIRFTPYRLQDGEFPPSVESADAYLICGSDNSVYENLPWMLQTQAFIRQLHESKRKLIGICFGHQLIAQALGGCVGQAPTGWGMGIKRIEVTQRRAWMIPELDAIHLGHSHRDQAVRLPPEAEVVGGNDHCPAGVVTVGDHILTFQGHPEYPRAYSGDILDLYDARVEGGLPVEVKRQAQDSLEMEPDNAVVARWLVNFLRH